MVSLPQRDDGNKGGGEGCGTGCGAGLEKIYPATAVRYGAMRWIGEFSYRQGAVFNCGGKVVIQTDRGIELGEQVSLTCNGCSKSVSREQIKRYIDNSGPEFYRPRTGRILREATPNDISDHEHLNAHNGDDIDRCALIAAQLGLDMKVVTVEHLLGGERIVFYFRSEGRIDFRDLVKELAHYYHTRIEMRQVGARDEARLVADYEICGRECCCRNFLKKLRPVTMRMAKLQKSTLDPTKVSGRCGRLRCCLRYEHEGYEELAAKLPNINSFVQTSSGVAQVIDKQVLTQLVLVRTADQRLITFPMEEITGVNLPAPQNWERPAPGPRRGDGPPVEEDPRGRGGRRPGPSGPRPSPHQQRRGPDEPPPAYEEQVEDERLRDEAIGDESFGEGESSAFRPDEPIAEAPPDQPERAARPRGEERRPDQRRPDQRGPERPGGDARGPRPEAGGGRRRRRRRRGPGGGPAGGDDSASDGNEPRDGGGEPDAE